MAARLTISVVSDTHGLVRREALRALRGADVLLHAAAGARRFRLPISVGRLVIEGGRVRPRLIHLPCA